jgi:hypothetical protein
MSSTRKLVFTAIVAVVSGIAAPALSEGQEASKDHKATPEEQAMMEKYIKAATPGPEHQRLAKMAGKWNLVVSSWMAPGSAPQKSDATAEFKPLFGGRYVQEEVHGNMGDQPFEGLGIQGFDNVTRQHVSTWIDNMSTGVMLMRGRCATDSKTCTMKGTASDPIAGKEVQVSMTTTRMSDDNFKFEMFASGPAGKPFKTLEIVYTRAGGTKTEAAK